MEDRTLPSLIQAAATDGDAVAALVDRYFPIIEDHIRLRLKQPLRRVLTTLDIRQSVCQQLLKHRGWTADPRSQVERQFIAFLRTLAQRRIAYHLKRTLLGQIATEELQRLALQDVAADSPFDEEALFNAIAELPEGEQSVLAARLDQQSWQEIGAAWGISEDAARMRHSEIVKRLRGVLEGRG